MTRVTCRGCGLEGDIKNMYKLELYDTPWEGSPHTEYCHKRVPAKLRNDNGFKYIESCDELLTDTSWNDFRYFNCEVCGRCICEQNPSNGWHVQYRQDEDGAQVCLKCYEKDILENGIPIEKFQAGKLPGMFFSSGNDEPLDAGYEVVQGFNDVRIYSTTKAKEVCDKAIELINSGHKVIVGYESMAVGSMKGYISLFAKKIRTYCLVVNFEEDKCCIDRGMSEKEALKSIKELNPSIDNIQQAVNDIDSYYRIEEES